LSIVKIREPERDLSHQQSIQEPPDLSEDLQRLVHKLLQGLMQQGAEYHRLGQLAQAEIAYRTVLQEQPAHADANHNLAVIALGQQDFAIALRHFRIAREAQPGNCQYWISNVDALILAGRWWQAAELLEDARREGLASGALEELVERMLDGCAREKVPPGDTDAAPGAADIVALTALLNQQRFAELEQAAGVLAQAFPRNVFGWKMLGVALLAQGRERDAMAPLRAIADLFPQDAGNLNSLGLALSEQGRLVEAEFSFARAIRLEPGNTSAHSNLGMALQRQGRLAQAEACFRGCIALDENFHVAHLNLNVVLDDQGRSDEAEVSVRRALQIHPDFAQAHMSLGYLQKDQGRVEEAEASTRRALELDPKNASAHSNLLFVLNYHPDKSAEEIFEAYQAFDAQLGVPFKASWRAHANARDDQRRLKVGYVCPSLSHHSTRHFLEPLLAHHNHARFEVVAYSELVLASDATTQRYREYFDQWIATAGMSDDALAQRIRDDRIDVLVDIAGHTRGNRLGVFARKPAPVSLHWLDFGYTTGLSAIDYYLTDTVTAPAGSEHLFSETPWRLPVPGLVYRPGPGMGEAGPLPALARGYVTFGTLTRAIRINHRTIRVWAAILRRVPGARLVVDSANFRTPAAQEALAQRFMAHGIDRDRLEIGCHSPPWDVLRGIDIGLDCFPHNSGTTLFEMLFMGVPYVTLAGRPAVGRLGASILHGMSRSEWVAHSEQTYEDAAVALALDLPGLQQVRAGLRARMKASPLMDESGFTRHVEHAYCRMFEQWSATAQLAEPAAEPASPELVALQEPPSLDQALQRAIHQSMEIALAHHRAGQLRTAEEMYRALLELAPDHPDANHNLAVIALETGHASASLRYFERAQAAQPGNWQYWLSYFDALLHAGDHPAATLLLEHKRRFGISVPVLLELVERLVASRFESESEARNRRVQDVAAQPKRGKKNKAVPQPSDQQVGKIETLFKQNQLDDVVRLARRMTRQFPANAFGWKALGAALVNQGEFADALAPLQKAVDCSPGDAGALSNLGFALQNQRRPIEAEASLRLALLYRPDFASAVVNLGATVLSQDRYEEAATLYRRALDIEPSYIPAHSHLAQVLDEQGRLVEAVAGFRKMLGLMEASGRTGSRQVDLLVANAHQGLSSAYAKLADFENVVSESDAALAILPDDKILWEKRLYAFSYHSDLSVDDIFAEFVRWGNRFPQPATDFLHHDHTPGRRLKVGYVSPDFRGHTSRFYFLPFFSNHDHAVVELFAYSNVKVEDACTSEFKAVFDHWRDIREHSDAEVAAMVRADGIDILVDGCNHMRDDRLGVFVLKPAPIQVTWLGAAWTTGLKAVDYVLFDPYIAPPETIARENIVRLPHCFVPFQSMADAGFPAAPPSVKNGYVTFAYSGRTERLNHHTFRVWGEILRRMPTARLVLDFRHFADPLNRQHFYALMARHGLDMERVVMRNSSNIFEGLHDFDILLDCFPHSGGTMLMDALWMGVPALTLAGRPPLGRIGTTFVTNIGLPQWVAYSEQEYIDKACAFGSDTQGLIELRAGMRERMLNSRLMDGKGFALGVESAYRTMWERFCAGEAPAPITVLPEGRNA
jgi:protein O-GlcNAc transferase